MDNKPKNNVSAFFSKDRYYIGFIGIAVLVVGLIVVLYLNFFKPPSKADYEAANAKLDTTIDKRTAMNKPYAALLSAIREKAVEANSTDAAYEAVASEQKAFSNAQATFLKSVDDLGNEAAFRNSEAKKSYDAFTEREQKRTTFITNYVKGETVRVYVFSEKSCGQLSTTASRSLVSKTDVNENLRKQIELFERGNTVCKKDLGVLKQSGNAAFIELADAYQKSNDAYLNVLKEALALKGGTQLLSLSNGGKERIDAVNAFVSSYTTNQSKALSQNVSVDNERKALVSTLEKLAKEAS